MQPNRQVVSLSVLQELQKHGDKKDHAPLKCDKLSKKNAPFTFAMLGADKCHVVCSSRNV